MGNSDWLSQRTSERRTLRPFDTTNQIVQATHARDINGVTKESGHELDACQIGADTLA